jgi:pimeloyl-ACP methyl ester carboxylesterase
VNEGDIEAGGVRLHYLEWVPDANSVSAPPLFLLHGLSSNSHYWKRMVRHLPGRRIVALDQRGHGLSDRPAAGYAMANLIDDASTAIAELGLARPIVVGHSWGAAVALEVVAARQDLIGGLVFVDGPVMSMAHVLSWDQAQVVMQPPLPRFRSFDDARAESVGDFKEAWDDDLEAFVKARVVADGDALVLTLTAPVRLEIIRSLYYGQPELLWPQLTVPTCVLLAAAGPSMMSSWKRKAAAELANLAPAIDVRWYDTPHDVPLYKPAELAADIERVSSLSSRTSATSEPAAGD